MKINNHMRHCIIMTAYKDVEGINRFIKFTPPEFDIYIHVDRRANITLTDIDNRAHVYSEYKIHWGAVEHLEAIWFLMEKATEDDRGYDYYHLVSGQDFYATPLKNIDNVLGNEGINYMGIFLLPNENWAWNGGYDIFRYRTLASLCDVRKLPMRWVNKLLIQSQKILRLGRSLPDIPLYGGPVWSTLHGSFVRWMLKSNMASNLLQRLSNTTNAEEVFLASVVMNSPFKNKVKKDVTLRYVDWHVECPPKTLTEEDFESVKSSHSLFCRKVDTVRSSKLIQLLEGYVSE